MLDAMRAVTAAAGRAAAHMDAQAKLERLWQDADRAAAAFRAEGVQLPSIGVFIRETQTSRLLVDGPSPSFQLAGLHEVDRADIAFEFPFLQDLLGLYDRALESSRDGVTVLTVARLLPWIKQGTPAFLNFAGKVGRQAFDSMEPQEKRRIFYGCMVGGSALVLSVAAIKCGLSHATVDESSGSGVAGSMLLPVWGASAGFWPWPRRRRRALGGQPVFVEGRTLRQECEDSEGQAED